MVARFRLFEIRHKDARGDVFTLVDSRGQEFQGRKYFSYMGFNHQPWHPAYGIGLSAEFDHATWAKHCAMNCKNLGTRIGIEDIENQELKDWIQKVVKDWGGTEASLVRGRNSLRERAARKAQKK